MRQTKLILFYAILFFASAAWAQFTTVTGTVVDPNGLPYANGTIVPTLITSATPTLNGFAYTPPTQAVGLNSSGSFTMRLGDNSVLLPSGTQWNFQVCSAGGTVQPAGGKGPVCFFSGPITISGASQNISSTLNAAALALSSSAGSGLPLNNSPASLPSYVTNAYVFGDSIAVIGVPNQNQDFAYLVAQAMGLTVSNDFGVSGQQISPIAVQYGSTTPAAATASIAVLGANDISQIFAGAYTQAQWLSAWEWIAVYSSAPTGNIVKGAGFTCPTCSSNTISGTVTPVVYHTGDTSTTISATVSGTVVYVGSYQFSGLVTAFSVKIDGSQVDNQVFTVTGPMPVLLRYAGLASGSHSVVLTATVAGDYVAATFIAGNTGAANTFPVTLIGNTLNWVGLDQPTIAGMNTAVAGLTPTLQGDGLLVYLANDHDVMSLTAQPPVYLDGVHPSQLGDKIIAQAFLKVIWNGNTAAQNYSQTLAALNQYVQQTPPQGAITSTFGAVPSLYSSAGVLGELATDGGNWLHLQLGTVGGAWASIPLSAFQAPRPYQELVNDVSLTVNTPITLFTYTIPASSAGLKFQLECSLPWAITAGTGTNTLQLIVSPSQTPVTTTNFTGKIYTSTALAGSLAVIPVSASGSTSILTSGTITPSATLLSAELTGSLNASATAGTFAVIMQANGTTATAAAKSGGWCRLNN